MKNIVLGTWSWGRGAVGGDEVFGNHLDAENLKIVFDLAMQEGMNFWDTACVYGMGASERILASFTRPLPRQSYRISTNPCCRPSTTCCSSCVQPENGMA